MLAIIVIGYCLFGIGFAVITEERAEALGYDHLKMWFWFGFFGLFIALIAVHLQDENKSERQNGIFTISCLVLFGIALILSFYKLLVNPIGFKKNYKALGSFNEEKLTFLEDVGRAFYQADWYLFKVDDPKMRNKYGYTVEFDYNEDYKIVFDPRCAEEPSDWNKVNFKKDSLDWYIASSFWVHNGSDRFYIIEKKPKEGREDVLSIDIITDGGIGDDLRYKVWLNPSYGRKLIDYIIENRTSEAVILY